MHGILFILCKAGSPKLFRKAVITLVEIMLCFVMLFSSLPWGFSVADYIGYTLRLLLT